PSGGRRPGGRAHVAGPRAPLPPPPPADAPILPTLPPRQKPAAPGPDAIVPSYTDMFLLLAARALQRHPALNARWEVDRIVTSADIHIGIAVDTEAGLLVPIVRNVSDLTLQQIAQQT